MNHHHTLLVGGQRLNAAGQKAAPRADGSSGTERNTTRSARASTQFADRRRRLEGDKEVQHPLVHIPLELVGSRL